MLRALDGCIQVELGSRDFWFLVLPPSRVNRGRIHGHCREPLLNQMDFMVKVSDLLGVLPRWAEVRCSLPRQSVSDFVTNIQSFIKRFVVSSLGSRWLSTLMMPTALPLAVSRISSHRSALVVPPTGTPRRRFAKRLTT